MRLVGIVASLLLSAFPAAGLAATFTVNTTSPGFDGVCDAFDCSLLDAILEAEAAPGPDDIILQECETYSMTSIYGAQSAFPQIYSEITIHGAGATIERDSAAPYFRFFIVRPSGILTLERLTLRGGQLVSGGAGIFSQGTLIVRNSVLENNYAVAMLASWSGGAIHNRYGDLTLVETSIRNNSAVRGGGIASDGAPWDPATLTILDSSITGNQAIDFGGYTSQGGGILIRGENTVLIQDTTISSNVVDTNGGGVLFQSIPVPFDVTFRNVTISDNVAIAGQGGGLSKFVCGYVCVSPIDPLFENSIIANNTAASSNDWNGNYASGGHNIIGVGTGSFPITTGDQLVTTLADISGLIATDDAGGEHRRPELGNPGIDAGDSTLCAADDQLDFSRQGTDCEIGAIEFLQCATPPAQMAGWYGFDETFGGTAQDIGGATANDGTYSGVPTPGPGMVQGSLCFDGVAQSVVVPDDVEVDALGDCTGTTQNLTIDAWVKTAASGLQVILDKRESAVDFLRGYHMYILDGRLGFQLATGPGNSICGSVGSACDDYVSPVPGIGDVDLRDDRWHLVAVSIQRCGAPLGNMYIDGDLVHTFTPRIGDISNSVDLLIGERYPVPSTVRFKGCLDELELIHRALDEPELDSIYDAGWSGKCKDPCEMSAYPACGGACPDGNHCQPNFVLERCECATDPPPCDETAPACNGSCPTESEVCIPNGNGCSCVPQTPCGQAATPECNGDCPLGNEICVFDGGQGCFCADPILLPCELSGAPQCGGVCPKADEICREVTGSEGCECTLQLELCADADAPMCSGACDLGEQCMPGPTPADPCECKLCITVSPGPDVVVNVVSTIDMEWSKQECSADYNVYVATISSFADIDRDGVADDYGACLQSGIQDESASDPAQPPLGFMRQYLITGSNATGQGSLGFASNGRQRPNNNPCP